MDITIEVMLPQRGGDFSQEMNGRYKVLTPVAVYAKKETPVVGMQRTGYIHVTGAPDRDLVTWNAVLCEDLVEEIVGGSKPIQRQKERRLWQADHRSLPKPSREALIAERQITMSWPQFKALLKPVEGDRTLKDI